MIIYNELSSLEKDLGFAAKALYTLSNDPKAHYHSVKIPKGKGGYRTLHVPDDFLKAVQRSINRNLLAYEEISPYAAAYRPGGSTVRNACLHVGAPVLLKLDIYHFFDKIFYPLVKEKAFPAAKYAEGLRVLLTRLCVFPDALPQGAPTSPAISNIVMRDFDNRIGAWCRKRAINYTRYCDDMTFSGDFEPLAVIKKVQSELRKMGLYLNRQKTTIVRDGRQKKVTGIVVNEKINVPSDYRRKLRQEMHYCLKYGIDDHLKHTGADISREKYLNALLGRVNYVLSVTPTDEFRAYRAWLGNELQN